MKIWLIVLSVLLFSSSALTDTVLLNLPDEVFLPIQTQKRWTFPAVKPEQRVTVELEHRLNYPELSGWTHVWQIRMNGKSVSVLTEKKEIRLLNKPPKVAHKQTKSYSVCIDNTFYSLYSPDFEMAKSGFAGSPEEAYRVVLDVTDLVLDDRENQLEIIIGGGFLKKIYADRKITVPAGIAIRNLKVLQSPEPSKIQKTRPRPAFKSVGEKLLDEPLEVSLSVMTGKTWKFPAVQKDKRITMEFEHRIHHPKGGGWNPAMQLTVNGKLISAFASRNNPRLLNKPPRIAHREYRFFNVCDGYKWTTLYSPDFEFGKDSFSPYDAEAFRVVADISDLVFTDQENALEIRFGASWMPNYYRTQKLGCEPALKIRNVQVVQGNEPTKIQQSKSQNYVTMQPIPIPDFTFRAGQDALLLTMGKTTIPIRSSFSVPGKTEPVRFSSSEGKLETPDYRIIRKSIRRSNRIDFYDTFESKARELIGIRIAYDVPDTGFDQIRIGGDDSPENILRSSGQNPTVHLGSSALELGIGLVAVDDVFRVQNQQFLEHGRAGIRTENFALSPGEKRTVEWSAYPVRSADYFDFVNEVRRDWKVNFPIDGGFAFTVPARYQQSGEGLGKLTRELGLKYHATGCLTWSWIGGKFSDYTATLHGSALFDEVHRGRLKPGAKPEAIPTRPMREMLSNTARIFRGGLKNTNAKVLCYVHTQLSTEMDDWEKYPDSIITHPDGKPWRYGLPTSTVHIFLPTPENAFGKKTMDFLKRVIDELGFDGIYHDEFNHSGPRITYTQWDKVSVELDKNNQVKRKIGFVPLLKLPFNLQVLEEFVGRRKVPFVANSSPETRSELRYHFPRFEETFHNYMPLSAHLYTPVQLGDQLAFPMTPRGMMDDVRHALGNGLLYYYYINRTVHPVVLQKMYPFTPLEIHSGWLLGKERILTIHSGEYGWRGENALCVPYVSDEFGNTVTRSKAIFFSTPHGVCCRLLLEKNQCAVLVRIPVRATFSGKAVLENLSYENGVFSAQLKGPGSVVLEKDGQTPRSYRTDEKPLVIRW